MAKHTALRIVAVIVLLGAATTPTPGRAPHRARGRWEPVGLSGGGAMFTPAISPADSQRMMVNCDMSAAYVTQDGGATWRMISHEQLHSSTRCRPAWHPTDPLTVYAADGNAGLEVSHDGGLHWEKTGGDLPHDMRGEIAIDPDHPARMLAGAGEAVYRSADAGRTWTRCDGPTGEPLGFAFDRNSPAGRPTCFAATAQGVWRSRNGGMTWERATTGLPERPILAFAGGSSRADHTTILYCTVPTEVRDGALSGGIYRSGDGGATWQSAMGSGLNVETKAFDEWAMGPVAQYRHIITSDARPRTVYAFNTSTGVPPPHDATCYRSDDAGATWRATFQADPRYPGRNVQKDYVVSEDGQFYQDVPQPAIAATDPNRLLLVTGGSCYVTTDGGRTWSCGHTRPADTSAPPGPGSRWLCNGLVVTTTWNYYVDPFRPQRHYICYTDIGFAISDDRGHSWRWWSCKGRAPWSNTCYALAFDPTTPGKVWGAFSSTHDIPNANIIYGRHRSTYPGGVCVSSDFAETWKPTSEGLPAAALTSVVVDPRSPAGRRTLFAGVFGHGVYRSTDDGRTWEARNAGLGSAENRRVDRVYLHPDGTLFALVTALRKDNRFQADGVGLYRSPDAGAHWQLVNASQPLLWPKDFTVDPRDSRTIYLSACNANGQEQAGLYRTTDGGASWRRLAQKGPEHFGAYLHPTRPGWIYMTLTEGAPGAGLWLSKDNGTTWSPMRGLPFSNAQRVTVDAADPDTIYVTTFGGSVWRGPASED